MPCSPRVALALALSLLVACNHATTRAPRQADADHGEQQSPLAMVASRALYREADGALKQGEKGLEALRNGDAAAAADGLAQARARLSASATQCARTEGCALARIQQAQERLLERQTRVLLGLQATAAEGGSVRLGEADGASPLLTDLPESERSINLLNGQQLRDLIEMNEPLRAALREWLTWMRPQLLDTYENYQYLRYKMWPAYAQAGLPEALLFGIMAKESGGKVHAVSHSGASGLLQFMPATGRRYGLGYDNGFDQRFDPVASTAANVAYLNDQFKRLNNDLELVLGAYNGGESRMVRLSQGGARHFWDPRVYNALPPETREYVPMVLAAAWLFLHAEDYGLRFAKVDPRPGEIALADALSLNELAICLGQDGNDRGWFRTLRNLNPRWEANTRLPAGTRLDVPARAVEAYQRRCTASEMVARVHAMQDARIPGVKTPAGKSARTMVASNGATVGLRGSNAGQVHKVTRGETLGAIARKYGCSSLKDIADLNGLSAPRYALRAGQTLRVPSCRA